MIETGSNPTDDGWGDWISVLTGAGESPVVFAEDYIGDSDFTDPESVDPTGLNAHTLDGQSLDDIFDVVDEKHNSAIREIEALKSSIPTGTTKGENTIVSEQTLINSSVNSYNEFVTIASKIFDNNYIINGDLMLYVNGLNSGKAYVQICLDSDIVSSDSMTLDGNTIIGNVMTIPIVGTVETGESMTVSIYVEAEDTTQIYSINGSALNLVLYGRS